MKKTILLLSIALLVSCGNGEREKKIELPRSEVMSLTLGWGIVLTNYIRIRATPAVDGIEITALAKGAVVKVLDQGKRETIKNVTAFWYAVEAGSSRGWIFGQHLQVFIEQTEAVQAAADLRNAPKEAPQQ
jgi:hypothetical protein